MLNIFYSDAYRLRKGAAARNTIIGLLATILFLVLTMFTFTSEGFRLYLDGQEQAGTFAGQEMTEADIADMRDAMDEVGEVAPINGADFCREMLASNMLAFFVLPFIIAIFCADFSTGAYRNTLSYESSRTKVYLAKLALSALSYALLFLITFAGSLLVGGVFFGFGGVTPAFFAESFVFFLLLLPVNLGVICFGHCLVALTRKSSMTIAIYLIGLTALTGVIQMLAMLRPLRWIALLDWNGVGKALIEYWTMPIGDILIVIVSGLVIAAGTTAIGLARYRSADMA